MISQMAGKFAYLHIATPRFPHILNLSNVGSEKNIIKNKMIMFKESEVVKSMTFDDFFKAAFTQIIENKTSFIPKLSCMYFKAIK